MTMTPNEKVKFILDQVYVDLVAAGVQSTEAALDLVLINAADRQRCGIPEAIHKLSKIELTAAQQYEDYCEQRAEAGLPPEHEELPPEMKN